MKNTVITVASSAVLFGILIGHGRSQENLPKVDASDEKTIEQLQTQLSVEVQKAFAGALAEYSGGRTAPMFLLSLSRDLYTAQSAINEPAKAATLAKQYVDHTLEIERITKLNFEQGTGTKQYLAAATAERLRAEIELKRTQLDKAKPRLEKLQELQDAQIKSQRLDTPMEKTSK